MQEVFENIIINLENEVLKSSGNMTRTYAFEKTIEIVKQAEEEYNNGWIPVSERLPDRNKPVLIYMKSTTISGTELIMVGSCDNGFWFVQDGVDVLGFPCNQYMVIAWQPLPEPYQPNICTADDCPINDGNECPAAEGCAGYQPKGE